MARYLIIFGLILGLIALVAVALKALLAGRGRKPEDDPH